MEGEEPLLPGVVAMISVSAGSHASSGKCRSDFSLLPNLETANLKWALLSFHTPRPHW